MTIQQTSAADIVDKAVAPPTTSVRPSDIIDFVEESQIEVTESPLSDTMIQRVFKRFSAA